MSDTTSTSMHVSLPSELGYERIARKMISRLMPGLGFDRSRTADMETAVSEACLNAIEHGNRGLPGCRVHMTLDVAPGYVEAVIADEGISEYQGGESPPASIEHKLAGLAPARGMGLMLIGRLVDEACFLPAEAGYGNRFRLRVYRQGDER